jgi:hypothetical protein
MMVAYCGACLPAKVVVAYGSRVVDIRTPHQTHTPAVKNSYFAIANKDWENIYVEGDDAQTKANIIANHGEEFV